MKKGVVISVFLGMSLSALLGWRYWEDIRVKTVCRPTFLCVPSCHVKSLLSEQSIEKIQHFFNKHSSGYSSCKACADQLQKTFPWIQKVSFEHTKNSVYKVSLAISDPCCCINSEKILTSSYHLTDQSMWLSSVLKNLPHITVKKGASVDEWGSYVKNLSHAITDQYAVEWVTKSRIYFRDKKDDSRTVLLSSADSSVELLLQRECIQLKESLQARIPVSKGQKRDWIIDLRFKNQIIVFEGGKT